MEVGALGRRRRVPHHVGVIRLVIYTFFYFRLLSHEIDR